MEYNEDVEAYIRAIESNLPERMKNLSYHKRAMDQIRLLGIDPGTTDDRASPVFEVLSVSVHSNDKRVADGKECQIYGFIAVLDEVDHDNVYVLYNRFEDNPEKVRLNDTLSLEGYPFSPAKPLKVVVFLKDAVRNLQLVYDVFKLGYKTESDYDVSKTVDVYGECGYARVRHNTFNSALVGRVNVRILKKKDVEDDFVHLYGSITADLNEDYMEKMGTDRCFLFKRSPEDPLSVTSTTFMELSKSYVVVPASSFVWIHLDLWELNPKSKISQTRVELPTAEHKSTCQGVSEEDYGIHITIDWSHRDELFSKEVNKFFTGPIEQPQLMLWVQREKKMTKSMLIAPTLGDLKIGGVPLVEVYSVVVDRVHHNCVGIYGTIKVHDTLGSMCIFKREKDQAQSSSKSRMTLALQGPITRSIRYEVFLVSLQLNDDQGSFVRGYIEWGERAIDYMSWYDKPICSIIKGESGYVAVHYSIFSSAAQATIAVVLSTNNVSHEFRGDVSGSITARYGNSDHLTYYDKEFYRSTLFKEDVEQPVHLNGNDKSKVLLPLSKCALSAPTNCSLLIEIHLFVVDQVTSDSSVVQGVLDFKPFYNGSRRIESSNGFDITVLCEWIDVAST